jgi:hypothetical protein
MNNVPDWVSRAGRVEEPILEVGFIVWEDEYYGPEHGFSQEEWRTLREPVYQPALPFHHRSVNYVLTPALHAGTGEMVRYYRDVLRVAREHGRRLTRPRFWLRPFLFSSDGFEIPFYLHNGREDAESLLSRLETVEQGEIYDDLDEGWEVQIVAAGGRVYMRHGDFDTGEDHACGWCDRTVLLRQIAPLRGRLHAILTDLEAVLGGDYWSRRPERRPPR